MGEPDLATKVIVAQLIADTHVGPRDGVSYGTSERQHWEDTKRRAQAALRVYEVQGYDIAGAHMGENWSWANR